MTEKEEMRQKAIQQMNPFLKKHTAAQDCGEQILSYISKTHLMHIGLYTITIKSTEDMMIISEDGGAYSFFDDGGGVEWHKEWRLRYVCESENSRKGSSCHNESVPATDTIKSSEESFYSNPFGLSGIYGMLYTEKEHHVD